MRDLKYQNIQLACKRINRTLPSKGGILKQDKHTNTLTDEEADFYNRPKFKLRHKVPHKPQFIKGRPKKEVDFYCPARPDCWSRFFTSPSWFQDVFLQKVQVQLAIWNRVMILFFFFFFLNKRCMCDQLKGGSWSILFWYCMNSYMKVVTKITPRLLYKVVNSAKGRGTLLPPWHVRFLRRGADTSFHQCPHCSANLWTICRRQNLSGNKNEENWSVHAIWKHRLPKSEPGVKCFWSRITG